MLAWRTETCVPVALCLEATSNLVFGCLLTWATGLSLCFSVCALEARNEAWSFFFFFAEVILIYR